MRLLTVASIAFLLPAAVLAADLPSGHPAIAPGQQAPAAAELPTHSGIVTEVFPTGSYVYVHVKTEAGDEWLAGPVIDLKPGSTAKWNEGHVMANFASPSLKRTFESIRFVETLKPAE